MKTSFNQDALSTIYTYYRTHIALIVLPLTIDTLEIRSSSQKGLSVPDASLVPVSSTIDVIELMNLGQRNRAVGATALNDRSSRSHRCGIFYIHFLALHSCFCDDISWTQLTIVFFQISIWQLLDCSCSRKRFGIWSNPSWMHAFG